MAAGHEKVVVANRASGTLSIIDTRSDQVVKTVPVGGPGAAASEPMYVSYVPPLNRVFVSDRRNNAVTAFDARSFRMLGMAPLGQGAFHLWADRKGKQLWSVNDIDKTISVINPKNLTQKAIVKLPDDLVAAGGKPHDVALDRAGNFALVTVLGIPDKGYVLRYSTKSLQLTHRAEVGIDPHVGIAWRKPVAYVACEGSNKIHVLRTRDLSPTHNPIEAVGTHGTGFKHSDRVFYTTNLPGLGVDGLVAVSTKTLKIISKTNTGDPLSGPLDMPHNIALTQDDKKLYVTHSGHEAGTSAGVVTVYDVRNDARPTYLKTIPVGVNPFGIALIR